MRLKGAEKKKTRKTIANTLFSMEGSENRPARMASQIRFLESFDELGRIFLVRFAGNVAVDPNAGMTF